MQTIIKKIADYWEAGNEIDKERARVLKSLETDFVDVVEAFNLGMALQDLYVRETEYSNTGLDEDEIGEVIQYVEENIEQRKY